MIRTTDTQLIRTYMDNNIGGVLDISYVSENVFSDIPIDNLRKYISRFAKEGVIRKVSKGIYLIGESNLDDRERIISHYCNKLGSGMIIGNSLLYKYGYVDEEPEVIEIATSLTRGNKLIESLGIQLIESHNGFYNEDAKNVLEAIELLRLAPEINEEDRISSGFKAMELLQKSYDDKYFNIYIKEFPYSRQVYILLASYLKKMNISNKVMEYYENFRRIRFRED